MPFTLIIRLASLALRQFPKVGESLAARIALATGAVVAVVLVTICRLLDTIGVGLSVGSSLELKRGTSYPR